MRINQMQVYESKTSKYGRRGRPPTPLAAEATLESVRTRYVADLQRVQASFDEQMIEVMALLRTLLGEDTSPGVSALDRSRADYLSYVRERCRTLNEQVLELSRVGTHLFATVLGLSGATVGDAHAERSPALWSYPFGLNDTRDCEGAVLPLSPSPPIGGRQRSDSIYEGASRKNGLPARMACSSSTTWQ
jgi:hypothetical protein